MMETETKPTPQAFGSSGGKFHLARKISGLMPEHDLYVEPYAGGAAVFFWKEPARKAVLNDMDQEIAFAYKFIRDMSPADWKALQKKDWTISRETFDRLKAMKPKNDVDRFYRFYYLKKGSFRHATDHVNVGAVGQEIGIARLPRVQQRLRGVAIGSGDAIKMIDKYDSKDTLFYLDPPYPGTAPIGGYAPGFSEEDLAKLIDRLKNVRGKFIVSMDTGNAKLFPSWMNVYRVATKEHGNDGYQKTRMEILATNYDIKKVKAERERPRRRTNGRQRTNGRRPATLTMAR